MSLVLTRHMLAAEILKLRRSRGLMALASLLSVVMIVVVFGYLAVKHGSNPIQDGPAGGSEGLRRGLRVLGLFFGTLTAAVIGTEAGTADRASGVFRDLVATGRSRTALFGTRLPAALLVTWAFTAAGYVLAIIGAFALADGLPTPSAGTILEGAVWLLAANGVTAALAVGLGSLTGSRGITLTGVIGWQLVVTPLMAGAPSLGSARDALAIPALGSLMPLHGTIDGITMAGLTAVVVLLCWSVVPIVLGARRTQTLEA